MKKMTSFVLGFAVGLIVVLIGIKVVVPFEFNYNKEDGVIVFNVEDEIVSDYETIERRFEEDRGTTFKVYFEKE